VRVIMDDCGNVGPHADSHARPLSGKKRLTVNDLSSLEQMTLPLLLTTTDVASLFRHARLWPPARIVATAGCSGCRSGCGRCRPMCGRHLLHVAPAHFPTWLQHLDGGVGEYLKWRALAVAVALMRLHFRQNVFTCVVALAACHGGAGLTAARAQGLLLMALTAAAVNLVNLAIMEVGEWRGFLDDHDRRIIEEQGLETLMTQAYVIVTASTLAALLAALFAGQHAFCFIQLHRPNGKEDVNNNSSQPDEDDDDLLMATKDLVKRPNDGLNLKTPSAAVFKAHSGSAPAVNPLQPHPSWVYRQNLSPSTATAPFTGGGQPRTVSSKVKRSLSLLKRNGELSSKAKKTPVVSVHRYGLSQQGTPKATQMRHAVIRRHQSMYIHPRAAADIQPAFLANSSQTTPRPGPYKVAEVSGRSEVRPVVTLQRSKSTAAASLHYRSTAIEDLCEFQAGKSFDLPTDPNRFRRRFARNWGYVPAAAATSDGSSGSTALRYQSAAGTVRVQQQQSEHATMRRYHQQRHVRSSSAEDILRDRLGDNGGQALIPPSRSHFGSTESIDSLERYGRPGGTAASSTSRTTQTPASLLLNDDEEDGGDQQDRRVATVKRSNSRVASVGRLRLRVESFRDQQQQQQQQQPCKKAPSKPLRKTKPASSSRCRGTSAGGDRSDRSISPEEDNSSTSGYSSPSAGVSGVTAGSGQCSQPPSTSPPSKGEIEEEDEQDNSSKITVIQIVPATLGLVGGPRAGANKLQCDAAESSVDGEDDELESLDMGESAVQEQIRRQQQQHQGLYARRSTSPPQRELLAANASNAPRKQQRRRLPETRGQSILAAQLAEVAASAAAAESTTTKPTSAPGRRIFRPNPAGGSAPRPLPRIQPSSGPRSGGPAPSRAVDHDLVVGRIPLPPVPELDLSERDSLSPPPSLVNAVPRLPRLIARQHPQPPERQSQSQTEASASAYRSSLSRDYHRLREVQEQLRRTYEEERQEYDEDQQQGDRGRGPRHSFPGELSEIEEEAEDLAESVQGDQYEGADEDVGQHLGALLRLLEERRRHAGAASGDASAAADGAQEYLSQLENAARRLRDQLLMEQPRVRLTKTDHSRNQ